MAREPVILNIYDLSTWNWWLYYLGFGGKYCFWLSFSLQLGQQL